MLEAGIVKLVMASPAVTDICVAGGFYETLPKDQALPSWTYRAISDTGEPCLQGEWGFVTRRLQIDVYANKGGDVQLLSRAIDRVLNCYSGTLPDDDSTLVFGCFRSDIMDTPLDQATRAYCRILEYEIDFCDV